jgi:type II secretory pathway component GspD/PulD (secretin)
MKKRQYLSKIISVLLASTLCILSYAQDNQWDLVVKDDKLIEFNYSNTSIESIAMNLANDSGIPIIVSPEISDKKITLFAGSDKIKITSALDIFDTQLELIGWNLVVHNSMLVMQKKREDIKPEPEVEKRYVERFYIQHRSAYDIYSTISQVTHREFSYQSSWWVSNYGRDVRYFAPTMSYYGNVLVVNGTYTQITYIRNIIRMIDISSNNHSTTRFYHLNYAEANNMRDIVYQTFGQIGVNCYYYSPTNTLIVISPSQQIVNINYVVNQLDQKNVRRDRGYVIIPSRQSDPVRVGELIRKAYGRR